MPRLYVHIFLLRCRWHSGLSCSSGFIREWVEQAFASQPLQALYLAGGAGL